MKLSKVFVTAHDIKRSDKLSSHCPIAEPKTTTTTPTIADMDLELIENYDGKLSIYYGSSMGTCEDLAQRVCNETKMPVAQRKDMIFMHFVASGLHRFS